MKIRNESLLLVFTVAIILSACGNKANIEDKNSQLKPLPSEKTIDSVVEIGDAQMHNMIIEVDGQQFQVTLYDNETVRTLQTRLPMTLSMEELHGNEKFYYLEEGLPTHPEYVKSIQAGDIMLFGSDCLVVFFENFSTSYSYTRIGRIEQLQDFLKTLADGTVDVSFRAPE